MRELRLWHRRFSWLALIPWVWFALSGGLLILANVTHDLSAPVFSSAVPPAPELQLALALTLDNEKLRGIDFATVHSNLHVQLAGGQAYYGLNLQRVDESGGIEWLLRLHRGKFAGLLGQIVFSVFAAFLILFVITGVLLWRPRKTGGAREWHRWLGALFSLPLVVLFLTGSLWNLSVLLRPAPSMGADVGSAADWRAAFASATKFDSELKSLHKIPGNILAELQDGTRVYRSAGGDEKVFRPWTRNGWIEPMLNIHSGRILGWAGRGIAALSTFAALSLLGTGLLLQKKRKLKARPFQA